MKLKIHKNQNLKNKSLKFKNKSIKGYMMLLIKSA